MADIIDILNKTNQYKQALLNVKTKYATQFSQSEQCPIIPTETFNAVFILNFMIEMNQRTIDFLATLQNNNHPLLQNVLNNLLNTTEETTDINQFIFNIVAQINIHGKQEVLAYENYYYRLAVLTGIATMVVTLSIATAICMFATVLGLLIIPAALIMAGFEFGGLVYAISLSNKSCALSNKIDLLSALENETHFHKDTIVTDTNMATTTSLEASARGIELKSRFFTAKVAGVLIKDSVQEEYQKLISAA